VNDTVGVIREEQRAELSQSAGASFKTFTLRRIGVRRLTVANLPSNIVTNCMALRFEFNAGLSGSA